MKPAVKFALLVIVVGCLCVVGYKLLLPRLQNLEQLKTSDADRSTVTLRIGGDDYAGYFFITARETKKALARQGLSVDFTNDGGAYAERLHKFAARDYDLIVLPVKDYLQHGHDHNYPGVIIAAISESQGADGVVGYGDRIPTGRIDDINDGNLRIGYLEDSPNSFLLDLMLEDFDLFNLKDSDAWRHTFASPKETYTALKNQELDFAVLWEPWLSKAQAELPGVKPFWGSDRFAGYIVDVFVVNRRFLDKHPDEVRRFLQVYFRSLGWYANHRSDLLQELGRAADLKQDRVEALLQKIEWYDLHENGLRMFGVAPGGSARAEEGLINTIVACSDVMVRRGQFDRDPVRDPYLITNASLIEDLLQSVPRDLGSAGAATAIDFPPLNEAEWSELSEVGTMRVEPISFRQADNRLDTNGLDVVDKIAAMLQHNYPNYRVAVRGHTGAGDDEQANLTLSRERAQVVVQRLVGVHGLDADRLHAEGLGSSRPPAKRPGESQRRYRRRLARVEFVLLEGAGL